MDNRKKPMKVGLTNDNQVDLNNKLRKIRIQKEARLASKKSYTKPVNIYGKESYLFIYSARENEMIEDVFFDQVVQKNGGYIIELAWFGKGSEYNLSNFTKNKNYTRVTGSNVEGTTVATSDTVIFEIGGRNDDSIVSGFLEVVVFGKEDNEIEY